jgi:hypothetical protein
MSLDVLRVTFTLLDDTLYASDAYKEWTFAIQKGDITCSVCRTAKDVYRVTMTHISKQMQCSNLEELQKIMQQFVHNHNRNQQKTNVSCFLIDNAGQQRRLQHIEADITDALTADAAC